MRSNNMGSGTTAQKAAKQGGANQALNSKNSNMNGNSPTLKKATQQTGPANANGFGLGGPGI